MNGLIDFINRNYIEGIVNDTSYNHFDMITYVCSPEIISH